MWNSWLLGAKAKTVAGTEQGKDIWGLKQTFDLYGTLKASYER